MKSELTLKRLRIKQVTHKLEQGDSTLRRWASIWLTPGKPGKKRGPRPYQPDGPGTAIYYYEHEVLAFLDLNHVQGN